MNNRKIILVAAISENGVIGSNNSLPWKLKDDLAFFKKLTSNKIIIMGSNTFKSIGNKPLPNRKNVILSSNCKSNVFSDTFCTYTFYSFNSKDGSESSFIEKKYSVDGVEKEIYFASDINAALMFFYEQDVYIIGGSSVYNQFIDKATHIYRSKVLANIDGDSYFPTFDESDWSVEEIETYEKNERNEYPFVIQKLVRKDFLIKDVIF